MRILRAGLSFAIVLCGCHDRLFLHSTQHSIDVPAQRVEIRGCTRPIAGETVEAWYAEYGTDGRRPGVYVLAFHGTGGRAEYTVEQAGSLLVSWVMAPAERPGIGVMAVNAPGFGGSDGPATLPRLGAAALDAYEALVARAGNAPVFIYGRSMGTTAALHVSASSPAVRPAGLLLDRGPDLPGMILSRYGWWNLWTGALPLAASLPRVSRSVANARRTHDVPALFMLGTHDELVTPRNGHRVFTAYRGRKQLAWIDGQHDTRAAGNAAVERGLDWLRSEAGLPRVRQRRPPQR
jgi:pimeloyl-ACP methyl ester carboxylesterase